MKTCAICGKQISGKGPKKYCLACSKIAYKIQHAAWIAKHKTVSSEKTEMMKCERCGKEIKRKNTKQRYCIKCRREVDHEIAKKYAEKHYRGGKRRKIIE